MNSLLITILFLLVLPACNCNRAIESAYNSLSSKPRFEKAKDMGALENPEINEASGMVVSRSNPDLIWIHNDSKDKSRLFLIDYNGKDKGSFNVKNAENRDWEDIAIGPGPIKGINYIYVADIGDNDSNYDIKYIYRFPEPNLNGLEFPVKSKIKNAEKISFQFPDGNKDAETLMVDPYSKDIYIVSKREAAVNIYLLPYPQSINEVITIKHIGTIDIQQAVAGDISEDGKEILIKTYSNIYYWSRKEKQTVEQTLKKTPKRLPYYIEPQGEAVAWKVDGTGYFTVSEKVGDNIPRIYYYNRILK
ncbi:MAG: hypothetical protein M3Q58_03120 [Bacteroidota bacterium]|nr:hypothetical protein [Bacteroidota bacterium]